jgi:hypothetical protein
MRSLLMQTCRASTGHKNSSVVARAFSDYIAALPGKNITAADSKRLLEYEAVRDMAWDAAYVGAPGVARAIYNALRGVAGSRMLKQAERDMVALQPEAAASPWSGGGGQRQRGSGGGSSNSSGQNRSDNRPRTVNSVKACYGCGDKGHVRRDCPKNKPSN